MKSLDKLKRHIFMASKLDKVMTFEMGSQTTRVTCQKSLVTSNKRCFSVSKRFVTTKLEKLIAYNIVASPKKALFFDHMIM